MTAQLTLEHVGVTRPAMVEGQLRHIRVLLDVCFEVSPGSRLAITGPSGAGKTSLLRVMNRLEDPSEGQVLLNGRDFREINPLAVRRQIGMVFQQPFLFDQTVEENLSYPLNLMGRSLPRNEAAGLLEEFGLPLTILSRRAQQLSGGQQQRVALARSLTLRPDVLLLDEPSSALDDDSAQIAMQALLRRNREEGVSLVMVTHSREMMHMLAGQILLIRDGQAQRCDDVTTCSAGSTDEIEVLSWR